MTTRVLTGITTSGTPHLGNYAGAIRPSILASRQLNVDAFFFMADYHALIKCDDPVRVARSRLEIAATWIAAGLDTDKVTFYRQSDIPEIPELCWMLNCVTGKGLMNRAHAYKAAVDQNTEKGIEPDDGVTMGLFSYPVLMAADILMFNAHKVPVGRDQVQHLEMTRDIAQRFNHLYGADFFTLPEVQLDDEVALLPGLDGRKMSKSYDNTIPLFEGGAKATKAAIMRIVTDSRQPGEPKDAEGSHLYTLYRAFATAEQSQAFKAALEGGMGWGDAKQALVDQIEAELGPMRDKYADLMAHPERIEEILQAGAHKARQVATPFTQRLREAVGLRFVAATASGDKKAAKTESAKPKFVSFRDEDGRFRFRLAASSSESVLVSVAFDDPREAGQLQKLLAAGQGQVRDAKVYIDTRYVADAQVEEDQVRAALAALAAE
ncbi:tryptophan--tRNA ligase [Pusillimonas sp. CC-YST705]|uniref:Tryptophan--tRNA ligase n=1 Tax=Mesopusillimonas faecipullorum TaxID=2755040 RepID=A0ABS8CD15_9BURK|nr:tryptophan--tRNA ligase [Mesopusillimonas faecipullorum]MCB5363920.1 tryptophan--tRNA ligase [Mesopusillimonas faecipullorum]